MSFLMQYVTVVHLLSWRRQRLTVPCLLTITFYRYTDVHLYQNGFNNNNTRLKQRNYDFHYLHALRPLPETRHSFSQTPSYDADIPGNHPYNPYIALAHQPLTNILRNLSRLENTCTRYTTTRRENFFTVSLSTNTISSE